LLYINAGHNPPLLLHADGTSELLAQGSFPLGIFEDTRFSESIVEFRPGDTLVMYTDGVIEASNASDEQFGLTRLEEVVRAAEAKPSIEIVRAITNAVHDYSIDMDGPEDDLTALVIKVT
jgi:sigma-B regulation protein RsbU (phosphoserine phosphatase)